MSEYACDRPVDMVDYRNHINRVLSEFDSSSISQSHIKHNFRNVLEKLLEEGSSKNSTEPILGGINPLDETFVQYSTDLVNNLDGEYSEFRTYVEDAITDAWKASDIDLANEKKDYDNATADIKFLIKEIVKFFLPSDSKVESNTINNIISEITTREIITALVKASDQESIHIYTYTDIAKVLGIYTDVFNNEDPIGRYPFVRLKLLWLDLWTNKYIPFRAKILAIKCTEQIHFVSLFIYIYWIEQTFPGKFIGLTSSNKLIASEESSHGKLASMINKHLIEKPTKEEAHAIIATAVDIEMMCIRNVREEIQKIVIENGMLSSAFLQDMDEEDLFILVKFVANLACNQHGIDILYPEVTFIPEKISWFHKISLDSKVNFFEARNLEYIKVKLTNSEMNDFDDSSF